MNAPQVSVVIVSFGTRDLTLAALESVRQAGETIRLEAIVVDNNSPDDSAKAIAREHPWAHLLRSAENRGFAAGANLGARAATGEWLVFLNSDARISREALVSLLDIAGTLPTPGAIGPWIEDSNGKPQPSVGHFYSIWRDFVRSFYLDRMFNTPRFEGLFIRPHRGQPRPVDWVSGACLLIRRSTFDQVEGFDEAYFLYVEDMDLCFRLVRAGWVNYYVPQVSVLHELGKSSRRDRPLPLEGGNAPEYFLRKFRPYYPVGLQRIFRAVGLLIWMVVLQYRINMYRILGRDPDEARRYVGVCRVTLVSLFRSSQ